MFPSISKSKIHAFKNISFKPVLKESLGKKYLLIFLLFLMILFFNYACQNPVDQANYVSSFVKGNVLDYDFLTPVDSVNISIDLNARFAYTDISGNYTLFNIKMPRDQMNAILTASKNGYQTATFQVYLHSGDTAIRNIFLKR